MKPGLPFSIFFPGSLLRDTRGRRREAQQWQRDPGRIPGSIPSHPPPAVGNQRPPAGASPHPGGRSHQASGKGGCSDAKTLQVVLTRATQTGKRGLGSVAIGASMPPMGTRRGQALHSGHQSSSPQTTEGPEDSTSTRPSPQTPSEKKPGRDTWQLQTAP